MKFGERPRVFGEKELRGIYDASVRIFRSATATIDGPGEFMQALLDFGCEVNGVKVRFPRRVVDEVLDRIRVLREENNRRAEPPPGKMTYCASGQGLIWHDPYTDELRPSTRKDQADFSRICDALDLGRCHPTIICTDVPSKVRDIWTFGTVILNSRRPCVVSVYSKEAVGYFYRMLEVVFGAEGAIREGPRCIGAKIWINSPFMISRDSIDYAMEFRRIFGQPLGCASMPVMGVATPATVAGCVAQSLAECYMANVISLAVDGRLVGNIGNPLGFDMRYGVHVESGPDAFLVRLAYADAAEFVFGGRTAPPCIPSTMAKKPGAQAMFEKSMGTFWAFMCGARNCGCLGRLAAGDIGSPVELLMDLEMMRALDSLLRDVSADEEHIAEDVILRTIPSGARYMEDDHTMRFFREEFWLHTLLDRRLPNAWLEDPDTMVEKARREAIRLMEEAPNLCPLSEQQRREIEGIMEEAAEKLAG